MSVFNDPGLQMPQQRPGTGPPCANSVNAMRQHRLLGVALRTDTPRSSRKPVPKSMYKQ